MAFAAPPGLLRWQLRYEAYPECCRVIVICGTSDLNFEGIAT